MASREASSDGCRRVTSFISLYFSVSLLIIHHAMRTKYAEQNRKLDLNLNVLANGPNQVVL